MRHTPAAAQKLLSAFIAWPEREGTGPKDPTPEHAEDRQHAIERRVIVGSGHDRQGSVGCPWDPA